MTNKEKIFKEFEEELDAIFLKLNQNLTKDFYNIIRQISNCNKGGCSHGLLQ